MTATKLFISHASEDKADFVDPLVSALKAAGFDVWYDKYELTMGDSLLQKISQGLKDSNFGVVVLSPNFFKKKWTRAELDGLYAIESTERKVILPIWKDVTVEDVTAFSPILAGRLGAPTSGGIDSVVGEIRRAVEASQRTASFSTTDNAISQFKLLDQQAGGEIRAQALAESTEGVRLVNVAANELIAAVRSSIEAMANASQALRIKLGPTLVGTLGFSGSYRLHYVLRYENSVTNTIRCAVIRMLVYQNLGDFPEDFSKRRDLRREDFEPKFHHAGHLVWRSTNTGQEFVADQLVKRFLDEVNAAFRTLHDEFTLRRPV